MFLDTKEQWMLIFITLPLFLTFLINNSIFFEEIGNISLMGSILFLTIKTIERKNKNLFKKILNLF